jgi:AraC-like DNA-binding protein
MTSTTKKYFTPQEPLLNFVAIFAERTNFTRIYTLPYNTLVGIMEDGGSSDSIIENCNTHETWIRRQGYLYFTPANLPVLYTSRHNLHYIAIHFNFELYPGVDLFSGMKNWIIEYSPDEVTELFSMFKLKDRLHSLSRIREFCLRFCNRHWPDKYEYNSPKKQKFMPVLTFIREKATAATEVRELAAMMNLRPETFSREFSSVFMQSPKTFLQRELAMKASYLLQQQNYYVKEVAELLEFSSEFYFSKFFKRQIGVSPSVYRNKMMSQ